jgi:hypothetical protein
MDIVKNCKQKVVELVGRLFKFYKLDIEKIITVDLELP